MASDPEFVRYVVDQFAADCDVTSRKMFGEYGLYWRGVFFGLICDDRFFVKQTEAGHAYIGDVVEDSPYPGAKPALVIEEGLEDAEWVRELARITVRELPPPKPRR